MNANSSLINDREVRPVSRPQDTGVVSGPQDTRLGHDRDIRPKTGRFWPSDTRIHFHISDQ